MSADRKITVEDLLDALTEADVVEAFCHLPRRDQDKFSRWIGKARGDESHWRRIEALVFALRTSPFQPSVTDPSDVEQAALG